MTRRDRMVVVAGLAFAVGLLLVAGRGVLAAPPAGSATELRRWVDDRGAVVAAFALVRVAALVVAAWIGGLLGLSTLARVAGAARLALHAERLLPPAVRRAVSGAGTASLLAFSPLGPPSDPGPTMTTTTTQATIEMEVLDDAGAAAVETPEAAPAPPPPSAGTATMVVLAPATPVEATPTSVAPTTPVAPPATTSTTDTWTVAPGDSFWSIAEHVVTGDLGRPPTDGEVASYGRGLVAANADRLVSSSPDLVYPGQVFALPPVAGR